MEQKGKVIVVGGGVIGLSSTLVLAEAGYEVQLVDARNTWRASSAAAGILYPTAAVRSKGLLGKYNFQALGLWPEWSRRLGKGLVRRRGIFMVGRKSDKAELEEMAADNKEAVLVRAGAQPSFKFFSKEARDEIQDVLYIPSGSSLDPRELERRLQEEIKKQSSISFYQDRAVELIVSGDGSVAGVRLEKGSLEGEHVVVSAGALGFAWLPEEVRPELVPMQGEAVLLQTDAFRKAPAALLSPDWGPLLPRDDSVWLGGSYRKDLSEEARPSEFERILSEGKQIFPALAKGKVLEKTFGVRPVSPDGLPLVGPTSIPGLFLATGHGKDGILQSPLAARQILDWIRDERGEEDLLPTRFMVAVR